MEHSISTLIRSDFDQLDQLMKENSNTLGFLPREALYSHIDGGTVLGAKTPAGDLIGYLLYAKYPDRIRIAHLCVSQHFRGQGMAKRLFEAVRSQRTTQSVIRLNCRRDYGVDELWSKLGFIPVTEKPGRSLDGHPLTCWEYRLKKPSQRDLFQENASDQSRDVVIDTHVLIHFKEPPSEKSNPSKALLADFLIDLIHIHITDEVFIELNRHKDPMVRRDSRALATSYSTISHDREVAQQFESELESLLKPRTDSDWSDVRHIAKTAASDVNTFVTRDDKILRHRKEIKDLAAVEVVDPVELVIQLHESVQRASYRPHPVSGQDLAWRRAQADDLSPLLDILRYPHERKGTLRQTLQTHLSRPEDCRFEVLGRQDEILGARAWMKENDCATIPFIRAARTANRRLIEQFLVSDVLAECVAKGIAAVRIDGNGLVASMKRFLAAAGFHYAGPDYVRLCPTGVMTRSEVEQKASLYFPDESGAWSSLAGRELLARCSPAAFTDVEETSFIIPIKPNYAMSLFDRKKAGGDLFGGKSQILMRWANVYYRANTHHRILRAPGRLLWYESHPEQAISACSHLRSVEIGTPKTLFRRYRKSGALEWSDVERICHGDLTRKIMALEFSHTFDLPCRVTLDDLRRMEGRQQVPLQSPRRIDNDLFLTIMSEGFAGTAA